LPGKCGRSLKIVGDLKSTPVWLLNIDGIELPNIFLRASRMGLSMVTISERAQQIRWCERWKMKAVVGSLT
jgi:hypothetical protein